ncbi:uncharacterized protein LOC121053289 [Oryza brachyantha]|uniref:Transmembrane protein n=1 Tax=Oryza brachyantha TaxID=4533 RepID=J3L4L4_ORYBR|nr:uncharacterized protein LOC121053289 [Oryza brachyantha]
MSGIGSESAAVSDCCRAGKQANAFIYRYSPARPDSASLSQPSPSDQADRSPRGKNQIESMESATPAGKGTLPPTDFVDLEIGTRTGRPPIVPTVPDFDFNVSRRSMEEYIFTACAMRTAMYILITVTLGVYAASTYGVYHFSASKSAVECVLIFTPIYLLLVVMFQCWGKEAIEEVYKINMAAPSRSRKASLSPENV